MTYQKRSIRLLLVYLDSLNFTVVVSDIGESEYFMGYLQDDAALARDVLEALPGVILLLDKDGVIGDASEHVIALSGF
jgi:hypothetical protein